MRDSSAHRPLRRRIGFAATCVLCVLTAASLAFARGTRPPEDATYSDKRMRIYTPDEKDANSRRAKLIRALQWAPDEDSCHHNYSIVDNIRIARDGSFDYEGPVQDPGHEGTVDPLRVGRAKIEGRFPTRRRVKGEIVHRYDPPFEPRCRERFRFDAPLTNKDPS